MPLSSGHALGPYEILAPIGAGGMGEVYRARDTRLDRTVAIKVLPEHIAKRDDIRQRFEREARAVASLNHPNICVLFDIGSQDGTGYMVMEFMEGETLADRIAKGPIPIEQALKLAVQIADALDRAHRAGVTHRDVKPGNVMVTRDGVKVLDFGLAKAGTSATLGPNDATLTHALTTEGVILGTPQYMAPEQFEGKEADARADIWAFGAVLYEMVTGQKAFQGKSYSSLVGAILSTDPPPMAVTPFTPSWLERLVRRCLNKDPEERYQSMRDVVLDLRAPAPEPASTAAPAKAGYWLWAFLASAVALVALAAVHFWPATPAELPLRTLSINPPDRATIQEAAISPDGKQIAFAAILDGKRQLWVRPMNSLSARLIDDADSARLPFWSPDSRWIGFFAGGKVKKLDASGGPAQVLCDFSISHGGTWNAEGTIIFANDTFGLMRVPALGGTPVPLTIPDRAKGESSHRFPVFLPGGRRYLYAVLASNDNVAGIYLGTLDSKERTRLLGDISSAEYVVGPSGAGYLLFVRQGTLMAQPFDPGRGVLTGDALAVMQQVETSSFLRGRFSVSGNGFIVTETGGADRARLTWLDRTGKTLGVVGEPMAALARPQLSPDDTQVVFRQTDGWNPDIWRRDLVSGIPTRVTFSRLNHNPVWSPDGSRIAFASGRLGVNQLYVKSISGTGAEELLLQTENSKTPTSWAANGRWLLYTEQDAKTRSDLWILPMDGERRPAPFLQTSFDEKDGAFSPDGRWIAYVSDESGNDEVYVQPFPATGAKWRVSRDGGRWPAWRRDGKEIYWLDASAALQAAAANAGIPFQVGAPQRLFETRIQNPNERYAVSADGKRFLVPLPVNIEAVRPLTVIENWLASVKR